MNLHLVLLHLLWFAFAFVLSKHTSASGGNFTKHGCNRTCGNLTVPYPFGIGAGLGCSIGKWFDVTCNMSFHPPKAFISASLHSEDTGILELIDITHSHILVKNRLGSLCYDKFGNLTRDEPLVINLTSSPFFLSNANTFTVVGCDVYAPARLSELGGSSTSSCTSLCTNKFEIYSGDCFGVGCCNSSTTGTKQIKALLGSIGSHGEELSSFPCSYSFFGKRDSYKFDISDLSDDRFLNRTIDGVPLVLDWGIGKDNCKESQKNKDFTCKENSICFSSRTLYGGYRCYCRKGFQGNPYLSPGCQDVDECKNEISPCVAEAQCRNTQGSYQCICPPGYYGDGKEDGLGCLKSYRQFGRTRFILGFGAGSGILLLVVFCFIMHKAMKKRNEKKHRSKYFKRNGGLLLQQQIESGEGLTAKTKIFTGKELAKATDNFNDSRIIGQGGQGTVYKGMLSDGRLVAVKKSKLVDEKQLGQFINEVAILTQVVHKNVVKLLGCCLETQVPLLVYEFISNGTLYGLIHDQTTEFPFTWKMRLRIAAEVAAALAYLHSATSVPIYHRDIKSSNILLNEKYVAKVSDFGISRSVAADQTHLTTLVKGTFGYLDPEYFRSSQFTEKSDVYSFGVVLLELLTGQKPVSSGGGDDDEISLVSRFLLVMETNSLDRILDARLVEEGRKDEMIVVANLAHRCLNLNGRNRPNMKQVATELESIRMPNSSCHPIGFREETLLSGGQIFINPEDYCTTQTAVYANSMASSSSLETYPLVFDTT